ncbi:hypothetical protein ACIA5C_27775 [Actinoplanes sp. NPDC051343]|uniref:hypothetical protein n=1 Tax=Actinoplanes sp. NPDC051343 TaxID=3363906 RepID=UPI00378BFEFE
MVLLFGAGWGIGALAVGHERPGRSQIEPAYAALLKVLGTSLLVVAVTGLICFVIQMVASSIEEYRQDTQGGDTERELLAGFCVQSTIAAGGGVLLGVAALTTLRVYHQNGFTKGGLLLLILAGMGVGFAGIGAALAAAIDHRNLTRLPQNVDEVGAFLVRAATTGPYALGPGPAIIYAGTTLLSSCMFIVNTALAWFTLGLAGGALAVVGATLSVSANLRRLSDRAAAGFSSVRLSVAQVWQQEGLASRATATGGGAVMLLFLVRAELVPTPLRVLLSLLVVSGFVLAAEAPAPLLVALQSRQGEFSWHDAKSDRRVHTRFRAAATALAASFAATVWVTSFHLDTWVRAVLTLVAIAGFGASSDSE